MAHQRIRPVGASGTCMAVRAADSVIVQNQGGFALDGALTGPGDPAAQAGQAMRNIGTLLQEAEASLADIRKLTVYVTDRAWLAPVADVIAGYVAPTTATVVLVTAGLATPEMLVAIDAEAVSPA